MHDGARVAQALGLRADGMSALQIARRLGVPRPTVADWLAGKLPRSFDPGPVAYRCSACGWEEHDVDRLPNEYVYLLGLYLGDGCISPGARNVFRLRIALDARYPMIVVECEIAMRAVMPRSRATRQLRKSSFYEVYSYSKAWPCLLPQHGPGKKHDRDIVLTDWQRLVVERAPELLIRGLIHSDGCRFATSSGGTSVRYSFTNRSEGIRRIFRDACDLLGLHWTAAGDKTYVSRKADVTFLDQFVGPKR